jgi:SAM-dependent methyltransferase
MGGESSAYEALAFEYYNQQRHPTCANFRYASKLLARAWLSGAVIGDLAVEVGCGMSIAAEILVEIEQFHGCLLMSDSSISMLKYSRKFVSESIRLVMADAVELPVEGGSCGVIVASLGDPYNGTVFWNEMARVTAPSGCIIFTTPSFEWSSMYRNRGDYGSGADIAEFALPGGRVIGAPSVVYDVHEQVRLVEQTARLRVEEVSSINYSQIPTKGISSKLNVAKEGNLPVVTGYRVRKC